jgi:hypothetical protein
MNKKCLLILIPALFLVIGFGCKKSADRVMPDYSGKSYLVQLLTPENGSTITENPPTLTWKQIRGYDTYDVQVSRDESFDVCTDEASMWVPSADTFSYTLPEELEPGTYCWRVRTACYT